MRTLALLICLVATAAVALCQEPPNDTPRPQQNPIVPPTSDPEFMQEVAGSSPAVTHLLAQAGPGRPDPMITSVQDAAGYIQDMFTKAADQLSEDDYTFKLTPGIRSFGQLLAHVADSNYMFCSLAKGEMAPVGNVEKTKTTKAEIQKALAESFVYCDGVYAGMTEAKAKTMAEFRGKPRSVLALLTFRHYHSMLHYGNVVTYMRLRGKVPPASQPSSRD